MNMLLLLKLRQLRRISHLLADILLSLVPQLADPLEGRVLVLLLDAQFKEVGVHLDVVSRFGC